MVLWLMTKASWYIGSAPPTFVYILLLKAVCMAGGRLLFGLCTCARDERWVHVVQHGSGLVPVGPTTLVGWGLFASG